MRLFIFVLAAVLTSLLGEFVRKALQRVFA